MYWQSLFSQDGRIFSLFFFFLLFYGFIDLDFFVQEPVQYLAILTTQLDNNADIRLGKLGQ